MCCTPCPSPSGLGALTLILTLTLTLTRSRCNTERFRNFVRREDDATGDCELDEEMAELKTALKEKCGLIYSVYSYYCAIGNTADRYVMGLPEFQLLCHDLNISDPSSKGCKPADLDNIFISTNIEDATRGTSSKEQKAAQQPT